MKNRTLNLYHNGVKGMISNKNNRFTVYTIGYRNHWTILGEFTTLTKAIQTFNDFVDNK